MSIIYPLGFYRKYLSLYTLLLFKLYFPTLLFISTQHKLFFMNIFISNLDFKAQSEDLNEIFAEYGDVTSAKVITDKYTGRSRGFGFVEMPDEEAGKKAIEELNESEFAGKTINVSVARPKTENRDNNRGYGQNDRNSSWSRY